MKRGVFAELKRRNVLRAAAIYIAAAWALAQGIAQLGPSIGAPEWITRWFLVAAVVGFPLWIAFAWFYEFTPQGLKRESEIADCDTTFRRAAGRKLDYWIIGTLAVAVVLLVTNQFVLRRDATSIAAGSDAKATAATLAKAPQKSVAVLPLVNGSGDKNQVYFSDGLSEDLINALSQLDGLKVIGRNSSFQFRDSKDSPAQIGAKLGVAHLLEGSVRHVGDTVRITAQLINAADGSTLWSQHYDRPYKDLFALQDEITRAVAGALKTQLLRSAHAKAQGLRPASGNLAAYTAFLQGVQYSRAAADEAGYLKAIDALTTATRLDPRYAQAYAGLSIIWGNIPLFRTGAPKQQAIDNARAAANTALALDPSNAVVRNALGAVRTIADHDWAAAEKEYRRAIQLDPGYAAAQGNLASLLLTLGRPAQSVELLRKSLIIEPLRPTAYTNLAAALIALGRLDEAERAARKVVELQPSQAPQVHGQMTVIEILRGNAKAALAEARQSPTDLDARTINIALALQIGDDRAAADAALKSLIAKPVSDQVSGVIADVYALRKDPDQIFAWVNRAVANGEDVASNLLADPFLTPYQHDPRFAALCEQFDLPVPGETPPTVASTL